MAVNKSETGIPSVPLHLRKHVAGLDMMLFTLVMRGKGLWITGREGPMIGWMFVKVGSLAVMLFQFLKLF